MGQRCGTEAAVGGRCVAGTTTPAPGRSLALWRPPWPAWLGSAGDGQHRNTARAGSPPGRRTSLWKVGGGRGQVLASFSPGLGDTSPSSPPRIAARGWGCGWGWGEPSRGSSPGGWKLLKRCCSCVSQGKLHFLSHNPRQGCCPAKGLRGPKGHGVHCTRGKGQALLTAPPPPP